jgi:hypothetical protein
VKDIETKAMIKQRQRKHAAAGAVLGVILGLICHALPPHYQAACQTVLNICTGGH